MSFNLPMIKGTLIVSTITQQQLAMTYVQAFEYILHDVTNVLHGRAYMYIINLHPMLKCIRAKFVTAEIKYAITIICS